MRRFKITFFETPFYLCVLHIYHVTRVATLSVRILVAAATSRICSVVPGVSPAVLVTAVAGSW